MGRIAIIATLWLAGSAVQAQAPVSTRLVRRADSSVVGQYRSLAGRVLLGSGVLDSDRIRIFVEDSSGSALVVGKPSSPMPLLSPGDSVWAMGVVARETGAGVLADAAVTRVPVARAVPAPVPVKALLPVHLAALESKLVVVEGVVVTSNVEAGGPTLTLGDTVSDGNYLTVVSSSSGTAPLGLERFRLGDRLRVTGVLVRRISPRTGVSRHAIYPRSAVDLVPTRLTARVRTRIVHILAVGLSVLGITAAMGLTRRRVVAERNRALRTREEVAQRYHALLEQAPIGIVVHDGSQIAYANAAFVRLMGAPSACELRNRPFADLVATSAAATQLKRWNGMSIEVEVSEGRITYDGRECIQLVVHDVSERLRAERAIAESEARLRQSQKLEAVGQLAGGVAHDFNNILTIVKGNASLLLDGCPSCRVALEEIGDIDQAADRGAALTGQLLAFSRKQVLKPTTLELDVVVRNLERLLRRLVPENVDQRVTLNAPRSMVVADAGQIEQVILNLVVNAKDAMGVGGVLAIRTTNVVVDAAATDPRPELGEMAPGNYVCLSVSDTGAGMDEETRRRAFEPFFTTKEQGKGTGLGLAMVYGIAKQHDGYVFINSLKGMGTTVRLYLPRVDAAPQAVPQTTTLAASPPGKGTVLLVEDEPNIRKLAVRVLTRDGYVVLEAGSGMDAISVVQKHGGVVDLLVTDVIMPGLSGAEIAAHLRRGRPGLRVLFMSGYTDDHLASHGVLGAEVELLHKPFSPADLLKRVGAALHQLITAA